VNHSFVHDVAREVVVLHRLERARADVQRHEGPLDTVPLERRHDGLVEVQAGRRGSDRAGLARVDRLVTLAVARLGVTRDVGR
jgi:hypothetical protein